MNDLLELFKMDIPAIIVGVFLILAGINKGVEIAGKFSQTIGKPFKWVMKKDSELELTADGLEKLKKQHEKDTKSLHKEISGVVRSINKQIGEIKTQMKIFAENRTNDRAQSFEIQKTLVNAQNGISSSLDSLIKRVEANEERENERVQSEIKELISRIFIKCRKVRTITDIEFEVLKDLITTYEKYGGKNSFVHSEVLVEMYTWEIVKDS